MKREWTGEEASQLREVLPTKILLHYLHEQEVEKIVVTEDGVYFDVTKHSDISEYEQAQDDPDRLAILLEIERMMNEADGRRWRDTYLSPQQAITLTARQVADDYKDASRLMGVTESTVKTHIHRARQKEEKCKRTINYIDKIEAGRTD